MKDTAIKIIQLVLLLLVCAPLSAQDKTEMLKRRAAQRVGQLCDYNEFMANKNNSRNTRLYYRQAALNLFINKGEAYEEDGRKKEGVLMEVTSVNRKKSSFQLIKRYFQKLIDLSYDKVTIKSTEVANIQVSSLHKIDDNTYVCTCYFEQEFCGYRDGKPLYRDITRKRVKCYVIQESTEDGEEYIVRLGDVTALETRRL